MVFSRYFLVLSDQKVYKDREANEEDKTKERTKFLRRRLTSQGTHATSYFSSSITTVLPAEEHQSAVSVQQRTNLPHTWHKSRHRGQQLGKRHRRKAVAIFK